MVARSLQMLDMYLSMCIGRYTAFGSILKQNGTCYNSPKIMDATVRYTMVLAVHANLVHPLLRQADKVVTVSVISQDTRVALKVVIVKIMQHIRISRGIEILTRRVFLLNLLLS